MIISTINTARNKQKVIIMNIAQFLEVQGQGKLVLKKEQINLKWCVSLLIRYHRLRNLLQPALCKLSAKPVAVQW